MEFVTITDEENNTYCYKRYKGYAFLREMPGNVGDQLDKIANLKCRPDDVVVDVFPKSGTHWLYNTVKMLRSGSLKYTGTPQFIEFHDVNIVDDMESPRTFGSHLRYRFLPEEMKLGTGKVITIIRNPKDLAASQYIMLQCMGDVGYQGNFNGFLKRFVSDEYFSNGSWFQWMKDMEDWKGPHLLCLSYKDLKKNTYDNVVKMAKFLEVDHHSEEFLQDVVRSIQFEKLKQSHNDTVPPSDRWSHISEDGRLPIYRKGETGDWKNTFTVAQNEWFDKKCKEKVEELGLKYTISFE